MLKFVEQMVKPKTLAMDFKLMCSNIIKNFVLIGKD